VNYYEIENCFNPVVVLEVSTSSSHGFSKTLAGDHEPIKTCVLGFRVKIKGDKM
jgi:hypothetical protein